MKRELGLTIILVGGTACNLLPTKGVVIPSQVTQDNATSTSQEGDVQIRSARPDFKVSASLYSQLGIYEDDPDKKQTLNDIFSKLLSHQIGALNEQFDPETIKRMQMKIWGVPSVNGYVFDLSLDDKKFIYTAFRSDGTEGVWVRLPDNATTDEENELIFQVSDLLFVPGYKSKGVYVNPEVGMLMLASSPLEGNGNYNQLANMFMMDKTDALKQFVRDRVRKAKIDQPQYILRVGLNPTENTIYGVIQETDAKLKKRRFYIPSRGDIIQY